MVKVQPEKEALNKKLSVVTRAWLASQLKARLTSLSILSRLIKENSFLLAQLQLDLVNEEVQKNLPAESGSPRSRRRS